MHNTEYNTVQCQISKAHAANRASANHHNMQQNALSPPQDHSILCIPDIVFYSPIELKTINTYYH